MITKDGFVIMNNWYQKVWKAILESFSELGCGIVHIHIHTVPFTFVIHYWVWKCVCKNLFVGVMFCVKLQVIGKYYEFFGIVFRERICVYKWVGNW